MRYRIHAAQARRGPEPPALLSETEHQPSDRRRRLFLHRRDGVRVRIQRDRDSGVAKTFGDDFGVDANAQACALTTLRPPVTAPDRVRGEHGPSAELS